MRYRFFKIEPRPLKGCLKRNRWHFCENIGTVWNGVRPALRCLDITCPYILSFGLKDFSQTEQNQLVSTPQEQNVDWERGRMLSIYIGFQAIKFQCFLPPPPPHFYCFPSTTTTTTSLLLSLHHHHHHHISIVFLHHHHHCNHNISIVFLHHHHISIVFRPLAPPPHLYCFPSTTTIITTFLLFSSTITTTATTTFLWFSSTTTTTATTTFLLFSLHHHHHRRHHISIQP